MMKRSFLENLGIEKEAIERIMAENGRDIAEAKAGVEGIKAELEKANATIAERDKQLKDLKDSAKDNAELTNKIAELEQLNKAAAERHKKELTELKISNAVDNALAAAKAKTPKAVKAMLDMSLVKLDKDDKVIGLDEQIKKLSEADETKYLFDTATPKLKGTQPGHGGTEDNIPDTEKMTYSEMLAFLDNNPDAKI